MDHTPAPGFRHQSTGRNVLRAVGAVMVVVGLVLAITGGADFADGIDSMEGPAFGTFLRTAGGGMLAVLGLGVLSMGFLGAQSRYAAGETMPVVKDSAAYLSDGHGIMGAGRTRDDHPAAGAAATGPYCRSCGVRNDAEARFCDGCGTALA